MKVIYHLKMKGTAFSNDNHLKFIPIKVSGLRKKVQTVIVFLKLDKYLSQIIYRNFTRNFYTAAA